MANPEKISVVKKLLGWLRDLTWTSLVCHVCSWTMDHLDHFFLNRDFAGDLWRMYLSCWEQIGGFKEKMFDRVWIRWHLWLQSCDHDPSTVLCVSQWRVQCVFPWFFRCSKMPFLASWVCQSPCEPLIVRVLGSGLSFEPLSVSWLSVWGQPKIDTNGYVFKDEYVMGMPKPLVKPGGKWSSLVS